MKRLTMIIGNNVSILAEVKMTLTTAKMMMMKRLQENDSDNSKDEAARDH